MRLHPISVVASVALLLGCADGAAPGTDPCQAAADHIASCTGQSAPAASGCDPAQAEAALALSCDELDGAIGDDKADSFNARLADFSCGLGLYRYCPPVTCDAAADEAAGFLTAPSPIPDGASACAGAALTFQGCGACEYYTCREATARCGPDGYLMRFAHHYCERYRLVSEPHASPAARRFLERVRRCLVTTFDAEVPEGTACETMRARGFASHPGCYVETGFCELSIADWLLVLNTIDHGDTDFEQMLTTGILCLREWLDAD